MKPIPRSLKPRNPCVAPALLRRAGRHGPGTKARRLQQRRDLQRSLADCDDSKA